MPRLSIVLPNYNYARYLDERMRSILFQSYRDFELVILDDASTDESLAVIGAFSDPRIRLHVNTVNSGKVYASWNEALKHCTGELVLFAGADDSAERTMLERLVAPFDEYPDLGLSHCRLMTIDELGQILHTSVLLKKAAAFIVADLLEDYYAPARLEWQRLLITNFIWNASGVLMRRDAVEEAGGFDDSLLIAADWRLYLEIAREYAVAYVSEPLNVFRQLSKSVSKRLQGAILLDEILRCITSQADHLQGDTDRTYYDAGLRMADDLLEEYIQIYTGNNLPEEVSKLRAVREKYNLQLRTLK